jgi:hypothetical protein
MGYEHTSSRRHPHLEPEILAAIVRLDASEYVLLAQNGILDDALPRLASLCVYALSHRVSFCRDRRLT